MIDLSQKRICAVIVTFFPDLHFKERLRLIKEQVDRIIIVDNASQGDPKTALKSIEGAPGIEFIWNDTNLGVATALNQGCRYAIDHQYGWAITFDQDTLVEEDLIGSLIKIHSKINDPAVAIMGANYIDPHTNEVAHKGDLAWEYRRTVITSGSLIALQAYQQAGGFRDDFFIDGVDEEFCLKCCRLGHRVIFLFQPKMFHSIGKITTHHLFGLPQLMVSTLNHPSLRIYFISRNQFILFREYIGYFPGWVIFRFYAFLKYLICLVLFEKNKLKKFFYVYLGIKDAFFNKYRDFNELNQLRILSAKASPDE